MPSPKTERVFACAHCKEITVRMVARNQPTPSTCCGSCAASWAAAKHAAIFDPDRVVAPPGRPESINLWHWGAPNYVVKWRNSKPYYTLIQPPRLCVPGSVAEHVDRLVFRGNAPEHVPSTRGGRRKEYA